MRPNNGRRAFEGSSQAKRLGLGIDRDFGIDAGMDLGMDIKLSFHVGFVVGGAPHPADTFKPSLIFSQCQ